MAAALVGLRDGPVIGDPRGRKFPVPSKYPISVPRENIARLSCSQIFAKYWRLFCQHSSLVGLKHFVKDEVTWFEKCLWSLVYISTILVAISFVFAISLEYRNMPITSTQEPDYLPTTELVFPAVSICSVNRISLRSATQLATEMFEAKISNLTVKEIMREISKLGDLYESSFATSGNYEQIIQLISKFYNNNFNIAKIMKRLTPECSRTLLRCFFRDQERNCSDIFVVGKTENGFCCIFNYILEMDDPPESPRQRESRIYFVGAIGVYNGLSVTLDPLLDDYFYSILPTPGWKVMVFDPYDYPDSSSGSVSEILVAPLTEKYFRLEALGLHSSDNIRPYPLEQRGCIFPNERVTDFATYTNSYCIVDCKLMHIWKNCKCRPFFYPYRKGFEKACNVEDIDCLMKYYGKSYDIIPYETMDWTIFVEDTNAIIDCKDCYPDCDDMRYYFETSYSSIHPGVTNKMMFTDITVTNHSVLHIYFQKMGTVYLKQDIYAYWYEQLSNIGGLYGFFVGFSIISLIEIIYFVGNCIIEIFQRREKKQDEIPHIIRPTYWNEFFPYPPINAN